MELSKQIAKFIEHNSESSDGYVPIWLAELWREQAEDLESRTFGGLIADGLEEIAEGLTEKNEGVEEKYPGYVIATFNSCNQLIGYVSNRRKLGQSEFYTNRRVFSDLGEAFSERDAYIKKYDPYQAEVFRNGPEWSVLSYPPIE